VDGQRVVKSRMGLPGAERSAVWAAHSYRFSPGWYCGSVDVK
jgi:hypothetical protein